MNCVLDTHVFVWWMAGDRRLTRSMTAVLKDPEADLFLSVASLWEIAIKQLIGKLQLAADVRRMMREYRVEALPIQAAHALHTAELPGIHKDPFDRLIVAQCILEKMPLMTSDRILARYKGLTIVA